MLQISFKYITTKSEYKETKSKIRQNYSIDENIFVKKDKHEIPKKLNYTSTLERKPSYKSESSNLDATVVYDESCMSPDISNICSEIFTPKINKEQEKIYLNQTTVKNRNTLDDNYHNLSANNLVNLNIEKLFDNTSNNPTTNEYIFDIEKTNDFLRKLKKKKKEIKEKEAKLNKENEELIKIKESKFLFIIKNLDKERA